MLSLLTILVSLVTVTGSPPGTLISCEAQVSFTDTLGNQYQKQAAPAYLAVVAPTIRERPVYLCGGLSRAGHLADGMLVRFIRSGEVLDGIQLTDGRVLVGGQLVTRED